MPTLYDNFSQVRQYIDQEIPDLTSYVTKTELANASYVTSNTLNSYLSTDNFTKPAGFDTVKLWDTGLSVSTVNGKIYPDWLSYSAVNGSTYNYSFIGGGTLKNFINGRLADIESTYATTSYVADYVATYGGGVIDENIIPKETATYTLGDSSYLYAATYTSRVKVGNNSQMYNDGGGITFSVNNNNGIRIGGSTIYPKTNKGYSNGTSTNAWSSTYTENIFLNYNLKICADGSSSTLVLTQGGDPKYSIESTAIHPYGSSNNEVISLGTSTRRWLNTYTKNIYADTAYISDYHNLMWTGTAAEYSTLPDYTTYQFYLVQES